MGSIEPSPFGILLRRHRARLGLTQQDLAERAMISARTVSDLERGIIRHPYAHTARQLAEALELSDEAQRQFLQVAGERVESIDSRAVIGLTGAIEGSAPSLPGQGVPTGSASGDLVRLSVPEMHEAPVARGVKTNDRGSASEAPACPTCGAQPPADAHFCASCGTRLRPETPAREERKVVSILFVELVGFTSRSDRADPEDVRDLLRTYYSHVKELVERFGGTMEKFIGNAVMAVFGAPFSHTDDAERAVRAGLRALEAVAELNRQQPDLEVATRAGVNTGEALVAVGSARERDGALALGDVVNVASGLQTAAPTGRLVVGEETYRATRDTIRYEALPAMAVKGKREPLGAWLTLGAASTPGDRHMRGTPMVGRGQELTLLESVWQRAHTERRPHLVTIVGPPGIGKSRLAREFCHLVERAEGRAIRGRCLPYDTQDVYCAFAQQVKQVAHIFEQDPAETARAKLAAAIAKLVPEAEEQEVTRSLSLLLGLGLDSPVRDQRFLLFSARRLVECLGVQRPTLFVFEDVHWADAAQLDLITYLAAHTRDAPVMFLAMARPELFDTWPGWGSGIHAQSTLTLDPLSDDEASVIVRHVLKGGQPIRVAERLVDVAEGNPLFLEELAAALTEGANVGDRLPTTVRAAIAGRVDALLPEQRGALLAASVVGRVFWQGALKAAGQMENIEQILDALETKDLIRRGATSRVRGDVEFSFKHILIRDVCYATLPRAERRSAHALVARYIEQVSGTNDRDLAWLLAHHWEQAGEPDRAVDYLLLAADRAQEAMAESDAMDLFERAYSLAAHEPFRTRIRLLKALARVRFEDFDQAITELEPLLPRLEGRNLLEAQLGLARSYHWTERTTEALQVSERALESAKRLDAPELLGPAMARLSQAHAMRGDAGDLDRTITLGEEALRVWVPNVRTDDLADHKHLLATHHYWTGGYQRALELSREVRQHAVDPSSAEARLRGDGMEGLLLTAMGRYEEAFSRFDAVIALGRDLGRPVSVLLNYSTMAFRELYDLTEARRRSEESLTQQTRSPNFHMPWMNAEVDLIQCDVLAGEAGAAESRWQAMWGEVIATPAWERWFLGGKMAALRAEIALQRKDPQTAAEWAVKAVEMARGVNRLKYEVVARAILGKALLAMGRTQDAVRELQAARHGADALGTPSGRWRTRADLARALVMTSDDAGAEGQLHEAVEIIRTAAASLASERAMRFLAAPAIADIVKSIE